MEKDYNKLLNMIQELIRQNEITKAREDYLENKIQSLELKLDNANKEILVLKEGGNL